MGWLQRTLWTPKVCENSAVPVRSQLFLSLAHHANAPDEHYTRGEAELAIAVTAALLRLAPRCSAEATEASAGKEGAP